MKNLIIFFLVSISLFAQIKRSNKIILSYGTIEFEDTTLTLDLITDQWKHVTNNTNNLFNASCKYKCFIENDTLIVQRSGTYEVKCTVTFHGFANAFYEICYEINGELFQGNRFRYEPPKNKKEYTSSFIARMILEKNDYIRMLVRNTKNSKDITFTSIVITFQKTDIQS